MGGPEAGGSGTGGSGKAKTGISPHQTANAKKESNETEVPGSQPCCARCLWFSAPWAAISNLHTRPAKLSPPESRTSSFASFRWLSVFGHPLTPPRRGSAIFLCGNSIYTSIEPISRPNQDFRPRPIRGPGRPSPASLLAEQEQCSPPRPLCLGTRFGSAAAPNHSFGLKLISLCTG